MNTKPKRVRQVARNRGKYQSMNLCPESREALEGLQKTFDVPGMGILSLSAIVRRAIFRYSAEVEALGGDRELILEEVAEVLKCLR